MKYYSRHRMLHAFFANKTIIWIAWNENASPTNAVCTWSRPTSTITYCCRWHAFNIAAIYCKQTVTKKVVDCVGLHAILK